jgi:hypothetical protein
MTNTKFSLKGQCHKIFDYRFFSLNIVLRSPDYPGSAFSIFLKFPRIFATQGAPPVTTMPAVNLPPVSTMPAVHLELRRSSRNCERMEMALRAGEEDPGNKSDVKNVVTQSLYD